MGKILQACYGIKGRVTQLSEILLAEQLIAEGDRLVNLAAENKTFQNRTGNLINSFGSTLYINNMEYTGPADFTNYWEKVAKKDGSSYWTPRSGFAPGTTELERRRGSDYARRYAKEHNTMISPYDKNGLLKRKNNDLPMSQARYADKWDGALALDDFFDHYEAPKGVWQLVVVAALFYGGILEKRYSIKVISQIEGDMESLASKYHGTVKTYDGYAAGHAE